MATKAEFIRSLAIYLVADQAVQSVNLGMGKKSAIAWSALRGATPLSGHPTVEEAVEILTAFLT